MTKHGLTSSGRLYRGLMTVAALGITQASCSSDMGSAIDDENSGGGSSEEALSARRKPRPDGGKSTGAGGQGGGAGNGATGGATGGTGGPTGGTGGATGGGAAGKGGSGGSGAGSTIDAGAKVDAGAGSTIDAGAKVDAGTGPTSDAGAAALAAKLGKTNFMIGLGPDSSAYPASGQLDIRYTYLVGNADVNSSWTKWNSPDGEFAAIAARKAASNGAIPMFDVYEFAADGDGNFGIVQDATFMKRFWSDLQLLADKIKAFDKPAIVHLEPDFWGYAQGAAPGGDPTKFAAKVKIAPTCGDLPDDLTGLARCALRIFHTTAPKSVVGLHASQWAAFGTNGQPDGAAVGKFLAQVSGGQADFVSTDILDRDAGCFEAKPSAYDCSRGGSTGWYWDETNTTSPNFHEYLAWAKALHTTAGVPTLWWQTPMGVPSTSAGGTANKYRDNRVHYIFSHVREFIEAGGVGVCFGGGAQGQTTVSTDGGQFSQALVKYNQSPEAL